MNRHVNAVVVGYIALGFFYAAAGASEVTRKVPGPTKTNTYEFNSRGDLVEHIDPTGLRTAYSYNDRGLLESIVSRKQMVRFGYDALGNRAWMQDNTGTKEYAYDAFGRIKEITFRQPETRHIRYDYAPSGCVNRVSLLGPDRRPEYSASFSRDVYGRVTTVNDGSDITRLSYQTHKGEATRVLPDGLRSVFSFSPLGQLSAIKHYSPLPANTLISQYDYQYSLAKNEIRVVETSPRGIDLRVYDWSHDAVPIRLKLPSGSGLPLDRMNLFPHAGSGPTSAWLGAGTIRHSVSAGFENTPLLRAEWYQDRESPRIFLGAPFVALERPGRGESRQFLEGQSVARPTGLDQLRTALTVHNPASGGIEAVTGMARFIGARADMPYHVWQPQWWGGQRAMLELEGDRNYVNGNIRNGIASGAPVNVLVGGVSARAHALQSEAQRFLGDNSVGIPVNSGNFVPGDAIWAAMDQVFGGHLTHTDENLWKHLSSVGNIGILAVHSHGAITTGNLYRQIDQALAAGTLSIGKVVFLGANPDRHLTDVLDRRGVSWEARADARDPIRLITTPTRELMGERFSPVAWVQITGAKLGALIAGAVHANYSYDYHKLENYFGPQGFLRGVTQPRVLMGDLPEWAVAMMSVAGMPTPAGLAKTRDGAIGGSTTIFDSAAKQLAGIRLTAAAQFPPNLGRVEGAVWDPKTKRIVLVGDSDTSLPPLKPEHIAVALKCVLGTDVRDPQFSLDPAVPTQPDGRWQEAIYIPDDGIRGTDFGRIMYDADWRLKHLGFGSRITYGDWLPDGTDPERAGTRVEVWSSGKLRLFSQKKLRPNVSGFQTLADLLFATKGVPSGELQRARQWIVSDRVTVKKSDNGFVFDVVKMRVEARKQEIGADGRLSDVDTDDAIATGFARIVTNLYDDLAAKEPSFAELKELAKALAVAKWIKERSIVTELSWIEEQAAKRQDAVKLVTRLDESHERRRSVPGGVEVMKVVLSGGVDLTVRPEDVADDGRAALFEQNVLAALADTAQPVFSVSDGKRTLTAVVLPISEPGRAMWTTRDCVVKDGVTYRFGPRDQIVEAADELGNRGRYAWTDSGHLKRMEWESDAGWRASTSETAVGRILEITTPAKHTFKHEYGATGLLDRIVVDGDEYASCCYQNEGRDVTVAYAGSFKEGFVYDENGRISEYLRTAPDDAKGAVTERATFRWDREGRLAELAVNDDDKVAFRYEAGRVCSVVTPRGDWKYHYDKTERLVSLEGPENTVLEFTYSNDRLTRAELVVLGSKMEMVYKDDRVRSIRGFDGKVTECHYDSRGNLVEMRRESDPPTLLDYDAGDRLVRLVAPGSYEARCEYERVDGTSDASDRFLRRITVQEYGP